MKYYISFNLQYFQGEKTEKASPKKRRDAREKGQVVQTKEIGAAVSMLIVFISIKFFIKSIINELFALYHYIIDFISNPNLNLSWENMHIFFTIALKSILRISLPFLLIALTCGLIASYLQVGFLFTTETLKFKLNKINPISGFKRLFSLKSLVEMIKSIIKAVGVLYICYSYVTNREDILREIMARELIAGMGILWDAIMGIVIRCSIFLLLVAIFDFIYKKWENEKELKMSKQEIKDEYKQMEGDPYIKGKIKEKQRQMAMSRMMQEVPEADVVITNPTHYAIALKYEQGKTEAPAVVAKGKDIIAANIRKIARENEVIIVENPPLARALYSAVELGEEIPPNLYEAVADVLSYVYKINAKKRA